MVTIRLRHPRGVTTVDVDPETQTVDDLRVLIFSASEIPPHEQELKYSYPPKPLPRTDGPLSSIPITKGEQIIVTAVAADEESGGGVKETSSSASTSTTTSKAISCQHPPPAGVPAGPSIKRLNDTLSAPSPHLARSQPASPASIPPLTQSASMESATGRRDDPIEGAESVALPGRDAGYLQLRVVPDDNSCLFSAIGVIFGGGKEAAGKLRKTIAEEIERDADTWSEVMLGQSRESYIRKIASPETWGGAIELSIFAKHYKTEISSFDVATGRCDRFGEGEYDSRCLLVYSGIHYDAITLSPLPTAPASFHTTVFPVADDTITSAAITLVSQLKARHYYTDTANFDLRCGVCKIGLKGEKGAREHAMQTGHVEFGEF